MLSSSLITEIDALVRAGDIRTLHALRDAIGYAARATATGDEERDAKCLREWEQARDALALPHDERQAVMRRLIYGWSPELGEVVTFRGTGVVGTVVAIRCIRMKSGLPAFDWVAGEYDRWNDAHNRRGRRAVTGPPREYIPWRGQGRAVLYVVRIDRVGKRGQALLPHYKHIEGRSAFVDPTEAPC